jgi:hypothetical protein
MKVFKQLFCTIVIASSSLGLRATPILFDFESSEQTNPVFTIDGLTATFSSILPLQTQVVSDDRSLPFAGIGSMRLTTGSFGNSATAGRVDFSSLLSNVSLWAIDAGSFDSDFIISARSSTNTVLGSFDVTPGVYTQVDFFGIGDIAALTFTANSVNVAYWDNLLATTVVSQVSEPNTASFILLMLAGLAYKRGKRSSL